MSEGMVFARDSLVSLDHRQPELRRYTELKAIGVDQGVFGHRRQLGRVRLMKRGPTRIPRLHGTEATSQHAYVPQLSSTSSGWSQPQSLHLTCCLIAARQAFKQARSLTASC